MSLLTEHLLAALGQAQVQDAPFRHLLLSDVLPDETARAVLALPFPAPVIGDTMGKRETHNATRNFFGAEQCAEHPVCAALAETFQDSKVIASLEARAQTALSGMSLRIEYCQDRDGFYLEPHTDIGAKRFTMLVYLSDCPEAEGWGTDVYDTEHRHAGTAPGGFNKGLIFVPGKDTWHGVAKRTFAGVRRSLIVNYVGPEWRARHELAFPDAAIP